MERMACRAQTIVADVALAALAFALAFLISPVHGPGVGPVHTSTLSFGQLVVLYAALAGGLSMLFRRELSPWRYASIPDVLVLVRIAIMTVGMLFILDDRMAAIKPIPTVATNNPLSATA